jgi:CheY-like chemotaxis protein
MPGLDGLETARRIRALGGTAAVTPLWLLTANPLEQDAALWRDAGFNGCMAKPFRVEEIMRLLEGQTEIQPSAPEPSPEPVLVALPDLLADLKDLGRDSMRGLAQLFRTSSVVDLEQAKFHTADGDLAQLAPAVHRMASASASLHMVALNERCRAIETLARAEDPTALTLAQDLPELWERSVRTLMDMVE